MRRAAEVESYEARYIMQSPKYHSGRYRGPCTKCRLGRDFAGAGQKSATVKILFQRHDGGGLCGLQGMIQNTWRSAALMKHFLPTATRMIATRLLQILMSVCSGILPVPFRMGVVEGGSRAYMASYNSMNGVPMTVHPVMEEVTRKEWGQDGIICTDAGAMTNLVKANKFSPDLEHAAAASVKAGIGQCLDNYRDAIRGAIQKKLLTEAEIDRSLTGVFRVMIKLGLLDPPAQVPYSKIGSEAEEPWATENHKALARLVTQKSIVLLKNSTSLLPLDRKNLKSVAVIGPRANEVLWIGTAARRLIESRPCKG